MDAVQQNTPFGDGLLTTARSTLEKCVKRDAVRRRLIERKLEIAIRLLKEVMLCANGDLLSNRMPVAEPQDSVPLNNLEIVRASVRTFGADLFSIDQLQSRIAETFPGFLLDRKTVSRRLFDLRREENAMIELVSENLPEGRLGRRGRQYLYRYTGPPC